MSPWQRSCSAGSATRHALRSSLRSADGERRVSDIVTALNGSQGNISGHLKCLRECGLVDRPACRSRGLLPHRPRRSRRRRALGRTTPRTDRPPDRSLPELHHRRKRETPMTVSRFHVAGMDCAAEEQLVRMALSDIDDIDRIVVDLDERDVLIDHAADIDSDRRCAPRARARRRIRRRHQRDRPRRRHSQGTTTR